mgnify:CR=1 FL=1
MLSGLFLSACQAFLISDAEVGDFKDNRDLDGDGHPAVTDCDDTDERRYPGAVEICDEVDNDCSGAIDDVAMGTCEDDSSFTGGCGCSAAPSPGSWPMLLGLAGLFGARIRRLRG